MILRAISVRATEGLLYILAVMNLYVTGSVLVLFAYTQNFFYSGQFVRLKAKKQSSFSDLSFKSLFF